MKYVMLIFLSLCFLGCSHKTSCNSFSMHLAEDNGAGIDPELHEKVTLAHKLSLPEQLWVLRAPAFNGGDIELAAISFVTTELEGDNVPSVFIKKDKISYSNPAVTITLKDQSKLAKFSKENIGKKVAIYLDGQLLMAPVLREELKDGQFVISGGEALTDKEIIQMVNRLNIISGCK